MRSKRCLPPIARHVAMGGAKAQDHPRMVRGTIGPSALAASNDPAAIEERSPLAPKVCHVEAASPLPEEGWIDRQVIDLSDGIREVTRLLPIHKDARDAILHRFGDSSARVGDYRLARRHGFDGGDSKVF